MANIEDPARLYKLSTSGGGRWLTWRENERLYTSCLRERRKREREGREKRPVNEGLTSYQQLGENSVDLMRANIERQQGMTHCARGLYILLTFLYFSLFLSSVSYLSLSRSLSLSPITQPSEPTLRYLHLPAAFNSEQGTATTRCAALPLFLLSASASSLFRCIYVPYDEERRRESVVSQCRTICGHISITSPASSSPSPFNFRRVRLISCCFIFYIRCYVLFVFAFASALPDPFYNFITYRNRYVFI